MAVKTKEKKPKKAVKKETTPKKAPVKVVEEEKGRGFVTHKVSGAPGGPTVAHEEIATEPTELVEESTVAEEKEAKKEKYYQAVGRRKESVAIVRLFTKKSTDAIDGDYALIRVNNKDYREYFTDKTLQLIVESALRKLKSLNRFKATVKVSGGGASGQADAVKHGLSRALVLFDQNFRKKLKKSGFLTRDSRVKERRKYGLKKARKAPQWQKR